MNNEMLLAQLMEQPEMVNATHVPMLLEMQIRFPYMQAIRLLLAKADSNHISKAATFCNGNMLYRFLAIKANDSKEVEQGLDELTLETVNGGIEINLNYTEIETPIHLPGSDAHLVNDQKEVSNSKNRITTESFFAFEKELSTDVVAMPPIIETIVPDEPDVNFVSKYDDDKLPYSFLWWLAKTRKEHAQIFQPYAQLSKPIKREKKDSNTEFQQQYVEHIFHIQTPFDVADHLADYPKQERKAPKGAEVIERFLKEDPTISAPKPEQINSENKAKKSAEERYDLVTETLAKIYIEQMLYPKAIDTYKKLSLKYPEKSAYFADLIKSIEKKL